jgi:uncharacterized OB-fold protein
VERFLPIPNPDTEPFWQGCAKGELLLQRCLPCKAYRHPPSPICHVCLSPDHEWVASNGRGTVYSFVVVHQALRGWTGEVPYVLAVIELAEGPHVVSNILDLPPDQVRIGMAVRVFFERASEDIVLPKFRPAP